MLFFKEVDFQDTPLGQVPKDWQVSQLGDDRVCEDIFYGITAKATDQNTGLRMLRTTDIKNYSADWSKLPFCEITENRNAVDKYVLKKGDIIIARAGTVGVSVLVDRDFDDVIFGSYLIKVKLKSTIIPEFAHYFLQSNLYWKHIQKAQGSTLKNINLPILKELFLPIPPLEEQRAIAGVLGVVDSVIAKADEVIAKTERLKKGLMQTLLTRGIGHKEFKETEIGKIPKTWQIVSLGDVCEQRSEIVQPSANNKEPFVGLEHIASGETRLRNFAQSIDVKSTKFKFYAGDILYGKLRPYLDKAVLADLNGICSTDLLVLKPKNNVIKEFLIYVLHSTDFIKHAIATTTGTNHPRTSWTAISKFKFGLPEHSEQQNIANILSTIDRKLELEKKEKVRLERIKRCLMDLLLTGKIRVKVDCGAVCSG
jgi:type I restriction enzyme S subunit